LIIGDSLGVSCCGGCPSSAGESAGMLHACISIQQRTRVVDVDIHDCEDRIVVRQLQRRRGQLTVTDTAIHHNSEGIAAAVRATNLRR
jgi:hypothetical protein